MATGLGIRISADLPDEASPEDVLRDVRNSIDAFLTVPLDRLALAFDETETGDSLAIRLHPAAPPVIIRAGNGELTAEGETSSAGPGYHTWLVELLEDLGWRAGILWDWTGADDTQYQQQRDFALLQKKMAGLLKSEAAALLKTAGKEPGAPLGLLMPAGDSMPAEGFAVSPIGHWPRGWVEIVAKGGKEQMADAAAEFFAAWENRDSAQYWLGRGMAATWLALHWNSPADEAEATLYKATLGSFAKARELDPAIELPENEIRDIWTLLNEGGEDIPPAPEGAGFHRGAMIRGFGNGWSANIPGYFRRETPQGLEATVFSFGDCSIHVATAANQGPDSEESAEYLIGQKKKEAVEDTGSFTFENGGIFGWAESIPSDPQRNLSGILGDGDETCFITIVHEDTEPQRDWAEKVLRSITRVKPA